MTLIGKVMHRHFECAFTHLQEVGSVLPFNTAFVPNELQPMRALRQGMSEAGTFSPLFAATDTRVRFPSPARLIIKGF
jgi:hypothetical protein